MQMYKISLFVYTRKERYCLPVSPRNVWTLRELNKAKELKKFRWLFCAGDQCALSFMYGRVFYRSILHFVSKIVRRFNPFAHKGFVRNENRRFFYLSLTSNIIY